MAKSKESQYFEAVGRRKSSVARVRLYISTAKDKTVSIKDLRVKQGQIFVNNKPIETVFPSLDERVRCKKPLEATHSENRFAISALIRGGGKSGQLDAFILGLSRALQKADEAFRPILKKEGYLTRDPRVRERRKVGTGGKARRQKQSPKR